MSCSRIRLLLRVGAREVARGGGGGGVLRRMFFRERRTKEFLNSDLLHYGVRALGGGQCKVISLNR